MIQISQEQAKKFAHRIYEDINDYIRTHKEEYEEFLNTNQKEGQVEIQ